MKAHQILGIEGHHPPIRLRNFRSSNRFASNSFKHPTRPYLQPGKPISEARSLVDFFIKGFRLGSPGTFSSAGSRTKTCSTQINLSHVSYLIYLICLVGFQSPESFVTVGVHHPRWDLRIGATCCLSFPELLITKMAASTASILILRFQLQCGAQVIS